ncbi:hypothetical protein MM1S1540310_2422 [Mycobacteroides abscessus subsp. bolletii 1S-154-0310]|uniref:Uncharacterized protein n=1 Tax=Mycobacteroides abscessus MAB_091912_2446 TaxID=1335414 RepID=A0A829MIK9_9MYCO|nr:hypothetical protein MM1S1540310_2422 [Mycobacteroides abscessus subsp. bolletii 1S-154-0310]EIU83559.1 hypothetical protein MM2B0626_2788 [Mycobacteroides abscessus subsp. bolletii 2B-0626]EIV11988.1 hypothetical protein MM2B0912R_3189 [Mycobacteroides abscessus subsp. bolletii 2B-0912-R]EIV20044.1 hypothetical protein MM2B0912S_2791 [Mycobacteroides abscessus subsp. bolletii 2B-0912-S]EIV79086.1 hypothetical protein MM2B0107_2124 [Mycobacteroides abscessus subsp. bolletii 2B-0107]ESV59310
MVIEVHVAYLPVADNFNLYPATCRLAITADLGDGLIDPSSGAHQIIKSRIGVHAGTTFLPQGDGIPCIPI